MDAESFTNETPIIREMGSKLFGTPSLLRNAYFILVTIIPAFSKIYKMPLVPKVAEDFFTGLMKDAMDHRKNNKTNRVDYLEYLMRLQQEKGLSNLDLAAHSMTFFFDGFETSSIFISNVLFEVCAFWGPFFKSFKEMFILPFSYLEIQKFRQNYATKSKK
jgi:hypothetical protein